METLDLNVVSSDEMYHRNMIERVGHQLCHGHGMTEAQFNYFYHYYERNCIMPYGVARARTGDPYDWVDSIVSQEYEQQIRNA